MSSVVTALEAKFGTKWSKEQLRKWWSDIKIRKPEQYLRIKKLLKKREKRLRQQSKDPRTPPSHQPEAEDSPSPRPRPPDELEEGEVEEVCDLSTSLSELLVVEGQAAEPFTTDSAQRLIGQIMLWNGQIDKM
ncbi:hypothetical protein AB205_0134070, partial [Aquarana catesbeiana]